MSLRKKIKLNVYGMIEGAVTDGSSDNLTSAQTQTVVYSWQHSACRYLDIILWVLTIVGIAGLIVYRFPILSRCFGWVTMFSIWVYLILASAGLVLKIALRTFVPVRRSFPKLW